MPLQDQNFQNNDELKSILDEIAPPEIFEGIKQNKQVNWTPWFLVKCVFLYSICNLATLTESYDFSFRLFLTLHPDFEKPDATFMGFIGQLVKYHGVIKERIISHLRELTKAKLGKFYGDDKYFFLAVDGTENSTPRTEANINQLGAAANKKKAPEKPQPPEKTKQGKTPVKHKRNKKNNKTVNVDKQEKEKRKAKQEKEKRKAKKEEQAKKKQSEKDREKKANTPLLALTLLLCLRSGLPWNWQTGGANSSERAHATQMIEDTPKNTVFVMDAGFVGYEFWKGVIDSGRDFIARVGANVHLLTELCYHERVGNIVYLWPDSAARKSLPPLELRLVHVKDGKQEMYLVTTLSAEDMSDTEIEKVYRQRWGIEVFFRTFKQTFEKRKMKSRNPIHATVELEWSLISLWVMCLYGKESLASSGEQPSRLSPAKVIRAFQSTQREHGLPLRGVKDLLSHKLKCAITDDYERKGEKTNREYPRKSQKKSIGEPKISQATQEQQLEANAFFTTA